MSERNMDLTDLGKKPVSGPNPAGADIREDAQYELLLAEIEKLNSVSAAGAVDWNKVRDISAGILAGKSKDLTVASYLAAALLKIDGFRGLAAGVRVLRDLLETYWDGMYPAASRVRARRNAIEWWVESVGKDLAQLPGETWPASDRDSLIGDLAAADSFLAEKMDNAPMLLSIKSAVESLLAAEPTAAPEPEAPSEKAAPEEKAAQPGQSKGPPAAAPEIQPAAVQKGMPEGMDLDETLDFGAGILGRAAEMVAGQSPPNPLFFKLKRLAAWLPVTELPPADNGRTVLPPPEEEELQVLKRLRDARDWMGLMQFAESLVGRYLFWLDLSRLSAEALAKLGHADSAGTVVLETQTYAVRLPGVENLSFNDGMPFADNETRSWLKANPGEAGQAGSQVPATTGIGNEAARAREYFKGGPLNISLKKISGELNSMAAGRERLVLETGLCRVLAEMDQPRLALSFAEDILLSVEKHGIDKWEPELAVEAFAAAAYVLRRANESEQRVNSLLNRIAVLDPSKALDLI